MNPSKTILITGNGGVGKSSLIGRLKNKEFSKKYIPTNKIKSTDIKSTNGSNYTFYEFPGQWQYSPMDIPNIDLHIIMYDLTNKTSFKKVQFWKEKVEKLQSNIPVLIVGNKIDSENCKIIDSNSIKISVKNKINIDKLLESID